MSAPSFGSFGLVSARTVASSSNSLVALAAWCPIMDLLAIVTHDSSVHVQRLNWQKVIALSLEDAPECRSVDFRAGVCAASALAWRPGGKAIAIGFHNGLIALLSIETKSLVYAWRPSQTEASITALRWLEWPGKQPPALQHQFLCQLSKTSARLGAPSAVRGDEAAQIFGSLTPLESVDEAYAALATPVGASSSLPAAASKSRQGASASPAARAMEGMRGVAHDAFSGRLTLVVSGDANGHVSARACGTLQVLDLDIGSSDGATADAAQHVLSVDVCVASGMLTVVTRCIATHTVRLHSAWVRPLLTHHPELLYFAQQHQQIQLLTAYIRTALDHIASRWKPARKSFDNKMIGLSEMISELADEAKERGEVSEEDESATDPISELLEFLGTGIPSYTVQQFVSRNLSAGNLQKSFDSLQEALTSVQATLALAIQPACEQLAWRVEELRASAQDERLATIGLTAQATTTLCERVGALHLHGHALSRTLLALRRRFTAFADWFVCAVRLINNEHTAIAPPSADATQEEKDAQEIPHYGPFDGETVGRFIEGDLETDRLGEAIGDLKRNIPGSLVNSFNAFAAASTVLDTLSSVALSRGVALAPFAAPLTQATPLVPASKEPLHYSSVGLPRGCALRARVSKERGEHLVAFLWRDDSSLQYVTVLSIHAAMVGAEAQPMRQLTVLVPATPASEANPTVSVHHAASVRSVDFYSPTELHLLVQYSIEDEASSTPASKMWLVDLEAAEAEDQWSEIDEAALATSGGTLAEYLAAQVSLGALRLSSLLPSDATSLTPSRSRFFPGTCLGSVALNSLRSLAAVFVAGKGGNVGPQPTGGEDDEESGEEEKTQGVLMLQQVYKPTRRVILLDIDEEEEEEEGDINESAAPAAVDTSAMVDDAQLEEDALLADVEMADAGPPSRTPSRTPSKPSSARSSFGPVGHHAVKKMSSTAFGSSLSPMMTVLISLVSLLLLVSTPTHASYGDYDPRYRFCLDVCSSRCFLLEQQAMKKLGQAFPLGADPFDVLVGSELQPWNPAGDPSHVTSPQPLTWYEKTIFGWNCRQNCAYLCMHANVEQRQQLGEPTVKYYGKWAFLRLWGAQEFFSSVFSILNAVPHVYWLFKLRSMYAGVSYPMKTLWTIYSLMNINTWLWSTVFHARDFLWTERLDYFCASLGISFSLCIAFIRIGDIRSWTRRILLVFLPIGALLCAHIGYLQLIHFDYGWNMKVSLTVGVVHSLVWLYNCWLHWQDGYHWRMVIVTLGLWCFASLEVYDFPPMFALLDAHSLWHGLTPILGFIFYTWVVADVNHMINTQMDKSQ